MIHGIVFDIDDTLYLERDYVRSGFSAVDAYTEATYLVKGIGAAAWHRFLQGERGDIFDNALADLQFAPVRDVISELVTVYRNHPPDIDLLPDSYKLLRTLRRNNIPLAVLTDGPPQSQRAKIRALGLEPLLSASVITSELDPPCPKPDPAGFQRLEFELGLPAANLTYIADNPYKDFTAPARRGWRTVRVRRNRGLYSSAPTDGDIGSEFPDLNVRIDQLL